MDSENNNNNNNGRGNTNNNNLGRMWSPSGLVSPRVQMESGSSMDSSVPGVKYISQFNSVQSIHIRIYIYIYIYILRVKKYI